MPSGSTSQFVDVIGPTPAGEMKPKCVTAEKGSVLKAGTKLPSYRGWFVNAGVAGELSAANNCRLKESVTLPNAEAQKFYEAARIIATEEVSSVPPLLPHGEHAFTWSGMGRDQSTANVMNAILPPKEGWVPSLYLVNNKASSTHTHK